MKHVSKQRRELLAILDNLEKSYDPSSPIYKFNHVFYNIVNVPCERPANFPFELWNQSLLLGNSMMPVVLKIEQIEERKQQNLLILQINESKSGLLKKIDTLKVNKEAIKNKLDNVCHKYRRVAKQYVSGEVNDDDIKFHAEAFERAPFVIKYSKDELLKYLKQYDKKLVELDKKVEDSCVNREENSVYLSAG